jgi:GT2 family glycosyltransferase
MADGPKGRRALAVVVVGYRPPADFGRRLRALAAEGVDVIGIANASGGVEAGPGGGVLIDATVENRGYAGGANAGIRLALARGADVVVLLNDDVEIDVARIRCLAGEADPLVAVAPRLTADAPDDAFAGGALQWRHGFGVHVEDARDFLTGAALAVHRSTWDRVGLFDESLFLYYEDVDWSLRARAAGVELRVADVVAHHAGGASSGGTSGATWAYYFTRNRIRIVARYRGRAAAIRAWCWTLLWTLGYVRDDRRRLIAAQLRGLRDVALGRSGRGPYPPA